jgi:hypothetical protein
MWDMIFYCVWLYDIILHQVFKKCFAIKETWVPGENHRSVASYWQTWSQEHVVLCIHIRYHPQYDQTLELTTLVLIDTNNLCNQYLSVVSSNPVHGEVCSTQHYGYELFIQTIMNHIVYVRYDILLCLVVWYNIAPGV